MGKKLLRFIKKHSSASQGKARRITRIGRHPAVAVPLLTISLLLLLTVVGILAFNGGAPKLRTSDSHIVIINHDKVEETVPTRAKTVDELLERRGIAIHAGDVVEPNPETEIVSDNFRVNVYRAVPVTIVDGIKKTFAYSAAKTPRSIVKQAGIEVYPEDNLLLLPVDNFLIEASIGERVVIERATQVNINIYGTAVQLRTHSQTVEELLKERDIKLQSSDDIQPAKETPVTHNMQIFLVRKGTQIATEEHEIPMPQQTVEDASLSFGSVVTRQYGSPGKKLVTFQLQLENGKEIGRKVIQEVVTVNPVPQIVARGKAVQIPADKQAAMAAAGIKPSDYPYVDFIISHESGWCPTKMQGQVGYCPPYAPENIPSHLGYGLGQATPGSKMAPYGADWKTNAVTQLRWATAYAGRYGGWQGAYEAWRRHAVERSGSPDRSGWW
ncbi:MAG TPA: ubiquitin-like domain-containing protein [Candidatus Saccharimonadales bacterium]|nr:ubiquitin-like domain-containing protein [Candidatus Saccharimonadales bacterium]